MSWIKVLKDNREYLVSTESYNELFKQQGYKIVEENKSPTLEISETKQNVPTISKKEDVDKTENKVEGVKNGLQAKRSNANKGKNKVAV